MKSWTSLPITSSDCETTCSSCAVLLPILSRLSSTILSFQFNLTLKLLHLQLFDKAGPYSCSFKTLHGSFFIWKCLFLLIFFFFSFVLSTVSVFLACYLFCPHSDSGSNLTWIGISIGSGRIVNFCSNSLYVSLLINIPS